MTKVPLKSSLSGQYLRKANYLHAKLLGCGVKPYICPSKFGTSTYKYLRKMAEVINMPLMSDTMTEGVIAAWHKNVGDKVKSGDLLAEIETDKATMEFEAPQSGVLLYRAEEGAAVKVNAILAIIGKADEDISSLLNQSQEPKKETPAKEVVTTAVENTKTEVAETKLEPVVAVVESQTSATDGRLKASPLAKSLGKYTTESIQLCKLIWRIR